MSLVKSNVVIIEIEARSDERVKVKMPKGDIMVSTSTAAAVACRVFENQIEFKDQLDNLLDELGEFLLTIDEHVKEAYITPQDSGMLFVVVQKEDEYNSELDDRLTDLEWDIAHDKGYALIQMQTQLLPPVSPESLNSFLASTGTMKFHRSEVEHG